MARSDTDMTCSAVKPTQVSWMTAEKLVRSSARDAVSARPGSGYSTTYGADAVGETPAGAPPKYTVSPAAVRAAATASTCGRTAGATIPGLPSRHVLDADPPCSRRGTEVDGHHREQLVHEAGVTGRGDGDRVPDVQAVGGQRCERQGELVTGHHRQPLPRLPIARHPPRRPAARAPIQHRGGAP